MALMDKVLEEPSYGWQDENGELVVPTKAQLWKEFFSRINIFKTRKNWLPFISWFWVFSLIPLITVYVIFFFEAWQVPIAFLFGFVVMSTHGTIWYHRYSTHRAYKFSNKFWMFFTRNLVPKAVSEELYVVSHHVHHAKSDKPGDPYNAQAGFLYCFLADVNHQPIARDLTETEYNATANFLKHTGMYLNSYKQYQKWGSISNPFHTVLHFTLNWAFWFGVFTLIAGPGFGLIMLIGALLWGFGVRTFNYQGHGQGKDMRREGIDYNWKDLSVNQMRPGILGGEWHNNHHLFPRSARAGFLPYQIDNAWHYIWLLHKIGAVTSYSDSKEEFLEKYYRPNRKAENTRSKKTPGTEPTTQRKSA